MRTLVVTNDFPPRAGGIQAFVAALAGRQPAGEIVVYASNWPGAAAFDATAGYPVVRDPSSVLLPVPGVLRRAREILRTERCDRVWFGAAAPLGLLAAPLRRAGAERVVASTHGHEVGWAALPGARRLLARIARDVDVLTYLGDYTRRRLARVVPAGRLVALPPGVDTATFHPAVDGVAVRRRYGLEGRPVVVCVSRLVPRKGQDLLIRALPRVRQRVPDASLLLVGTGPDRRRLERLAVRYDVAAAVRFTGSVGWQELPAHYAAGDVFAMPCRTRRLGLDVEGLGIVYLEASACGLPVVAGRSGGAPEAVRDGETGRVLDGRDLPQLVETLTRWLLDPAAARAIGASGRRWVESAWHWDGLAARLRRLLAGGPPGHALP